MRSRKKIVLFAVVLFLFGAAISLFFLIGSDDHPIETVSDTGDQVTVREQFGLGAITQTPLQQIPFSDDSGRGIGTERRDDRVYTVPTDDSPDVVTEAGSVSRLTRLFAGPTAGYRIDQKDNGSWEVRVVERGKGDRHLIQTFPYSLDLISPGEFTKVLEGHIFPNGSTLLLYESDSQETVIRSAFVPFARTEVNNSVQRFEDNIRVATNNENMLFFLRPVDDTVVGLVVDVSNPERTEMLWESSFTNWLPHWGRNSYITISSPISEFIKGYVYLLDPTGETPIIQMADLPSGGGALVDTTSGFFALYEADSREFGGTMRITDQARQKDIPMPITLPEKCDGFSGIFVCAVPNVIPAETLSGYETIFPDSWYQGDISFNDSIVSVNAVTGEKHLLMSPNQPDIARLSGGEVFDIIHPRISEDGRFLFFMNKRDLSLWMLRF